MFKIKIHMADYRAFSLRQLCFGWYDRLTPVIVRVEMARRGRLSLGVHKNRTRRGGHKSARVSHDLQHIGSTASLHR